MPKAHEESANDERAEEEDVDDDEQEDDEEEDESDEDDDSDDEDESEDSDDDESNDDDDDKKPITRKDLAKAIADAMQTRSKNKKAAAQRLSSKNRDTTRKGRPVSDPRVDKLDEFRQKSEIAEAKRQFGYENGLDPKEVDIVYRFKKNPSAKSLKDPILKGALEAYRTTKKAKDNIPGGGGRPSRPSGKEYEKLSPTEKQAHFGDRRRAILAAKKGN